MNNVMLPTWEYLAKKMIWDELSFVVSKKILDYGSGDGTTSNYFAKNNCVTAIEPSKKILENRNTENPYTQINGDIDALKSLEDESFDVVLCHNVLEYIDDKAEIIKQLKRVLKVNGHLSIVKHNRAGRIMQMAVLLNNFSHANQLLDGKNGCSAQYGAIRYYEDEDITECVDGLNLISSSGLKTLWDLQQKQEIQSDPKWQEQMLAMEKRISIIPEFKAIASFHHLIFEKL